MIVHTVLCTAEYIQQYIIFTVLCCCTVYGKTVKNCDDDKDEEIKLIINIRVYHFMYSHSTVLITLYSSEQSCSFIRMLNMQQYYVIHVLYRVAVVPVLSYNYRVRTVQYYCCAQTSTVQCAFLIVQFSAKYTMNSSERPKTVPNCSFMRMLNM